MLTPQGSTPRIYRPLAQLKDFYQPETQSSSVRAEVSSELPLIETKRKHIHFSTLSCQYSITINDILKMKLKTGHIQDEISSIDVKMRNDKEKYDNAVLKHRNFTKAFDKFLNDQYQQVKEILQKLEAHEQESSQLRKTLHDYQQAITEKSLKIYELEAKWRQYKTCERFLLHISPLLGNGAEKLEFPGNFRVDPDYETPTLDELILNFRNHDQNLLFDKTQYVHITASKMMELLSKLKRQNLKLLRYKLEQEKLTNVFYDVNFAFEKDFENEVVEFEKKICNMRTRVAGKIQEVVVMKEKCDTVAKKSETPEKKDKKELKTFVEQLYKQCFKPTYEETSHIQMIRYVEDYCNALLCELYSFEPCILKKVFKK